MPLLASRWKGALGVDQCPASLPQAAGRARKKLEYLVTIPVAAGAGRRGPMVVYGAVLPRVDQALMTKALVRATEDLAKQSQDQDAA